MQLELPFGESKWPDHAKEADAREAKILEPKKEKPLEKNKGQGTKS